MTNWFLDGRRLTHLPIDDRAVQYGDGLFETIAIRAAKPRLWSLHMDRLANGCERLGLEMPSREDLLQQSLNALQSADVNPQYCIVKILLSAGVARRGYGRAVSVNPTPLIGVFDAQSLAATIYKNGVATLICKIRLAGNSALAGLKTLNRLEQVLARSEFGESDYFEGFTLDTEGNIICGTMSNVFFVRDNIVATPPLNDCGVAGVMRRHVISTLREKGIDVHQLRQTASTLPGVDEVFLTNSQFGVVPVTSCGDATWAVGAVTQKVMALLRDGGVVECP